MQRFPLLCRLDVWVQIPDHLTSSDWVNSGPDQLGRYSGRYSGRVLVPLLSKAEPYGGEFEFTGVPRAVFRSKVCLEIVPVEYLCFFVSPQLKSMAGLCLV